MPPIPQAYYPPPPPQGGGKKWIFWGCGGCLGLLVVAGIAGYFIFSSVLGMLEKSAPYQDGLARAQQSPEVRQALGEPVEKDGMVNGRININNDAGSADLTVPLKGTKGTGSLHIVSEKEPGQNWQPQVLDVNVNGGDSINLLDGPKAEVDKQP